jgi:hypothetical protein
MLLFSLTIQTARAGMEATWELPSKDIRLTVEYFDSQNVRLSIEDELYLLVIGPDIYMVNGDSITDVNAFRDKVKDWSIVRFIANNMNSRSKRVPAPDALKATGKIETIAGIQGEVYHAIITNNETGEKEDREIVLTKHPKLVELKHAMQAISDQNMKTFHNKGFANMKNAMKNSFPSDVSILRYGNKFHVTSFSEKELSKERFQLPANNPIKDLPSFSDLTAFVRLAAPFSY